MSENNHKPAPYQVSIEVGGRALILESGKIAKQANGAVTARYGDTVVLVAACIGAKASDRDFCPLTVDYRENTYSAGKIPGGFFERRKADGKGNPGVAADRPADEAAVPGIVEV